MMSAPTHVWPPVAPPRGMMGRDRALWQIDNRRFHEDGCGYDAHEVEKAMLLDPNPDLGVRGVKVVLLTGRPAVPVEMIDAVGGRSATAVP